MSMASGLPDLHFVYPTFRGHVSIPFQQLSQIHTDGRRRRVRVVLRKSQPLNQRQHLIYTTAPPPGGGNVVDGDDDVWKLIHDDTAVGHLLRLFEVQQILDWLLAGHHALVEEHPSTKRHHRSIFVTHAGPACVIWRRDVDDSDVEVVRVHSICPHEDMATEVARLQPFVSDRERRLAQKLKPQKPVVIKGARLPRIFSCRSTVEADYTQGCTHLTQKLLETILSDSNDRSLVHFPLGLTYTEQSIIRMSLVEDIILLQGGAGTGKTLCSMYAMLAAISSPCISSSAVFITASATSAQARYNSIAQSVDAPPVSSIMDEKITKLSSTQSFPLFTTYRHLLLMLDAMLSVPFFGRDDERAAYLHGSGAKAATGRAEALACDFANRTWPSISHTLGRNKPLYSPERVLVQLTTHIRGAYLALMCAAGYVEAADANIHRLFVAYRSHKRANNLYDHLDVVHHVHTRLLMEAVTPTTINRLYIDEVQDLTQAEIAVLFRITPKGERHMFLTGDVLQAVTVDFRFRDVLTVLESEASGLPEWWMAELDSTEAAAPQRTDSRKMHRRHGKSRRDRVPPEEQPSPACIKPRPLVQRNTHTQVTHLHSHCFRCLRGVLQLANSVRDLLEHIFWDTTTKQPFGAEDGPRPVTILYQHLSLVVNSMIARIASTEQRTVAFLFQSSHRKAAAIAVCNQMCNHQLVVFLTIAEAKGQEFDVVVIVDFFKDSAFDRWTVLQQYTRSDRALEWLRGQQRGQSPFFPIDQAYGEQLHPATTLEAEGRDWMLQTELKLLFVAVTRARAEVFVLEDSRDAKAQAMIQLWVCQQVIADPMRDDDCLIRYLAHRGTSQDAALLMAAEEHKGDTDAWLWVARCHEFALNVRGTHYGAAMAIMATLDDLPRQRTKLLQRAMWRFRAGQFHLEAAECLERLGDWSQAAEEWSVVLREDTTESIILLKRAWLAWVKLGNHALTVDFLQRHMDRLGWDDVCDWVVNDLRHAANPGEARQAPLLALMLNQPLLAARWHLEDREYHKSVAAFGQAAQPLTWADAHRLAQAYDCTGAVQAAGMYIALGLPDDAGRVLEAHGRTDEAVALCSSPEAVAACYQRCGRFSEAGDAFWSCSLLVDASHAFCDAADADPDRRVYFLQRAVGCIFTRGYPHKGSDCVRIAKLLTRLLHGDHLSDHLLRCWDWRPLGVQDSAARLRAAGMHAWAAQCCSQHADWHAAIEDLTRAPRNNAVTATVAAHCLWEWVGLYLGERDTDEGNSKIYLDTAASLDAMWTLVLPLVTNHERLYRELLRAYNVDMLPLLLRHSGGPHEIHIHEVSTRCLLIKAFAGLCRLHVCGNCHQDANTPRRHVHKVPCSLHLMTQDVFMTLGGMPMYLQQLHSPEPEVTEQMAQLERVYTIIRSNCSCYTVSYLLVAALVPQCHARVLRVLNDPRYGTVHVCPPVTHYRPVPTTPVYLPHLCTVYPLHLTRQVVAGRSGTTSVFSIVRQLLQKYNVVEEVSGEFTLPWLRSCANCCC